MTDNVTTWLAIRWPREVRSEDVEAAWRILNSLANRGLVIESIGAEGLVRHRIGVAAGRVEIIIRELETAIPGISVAQVDSEELEPKEFNQALSLRLNTRRRTIKTDDLATASRTILTALSTARNDERLIVRWTLGVRQGPLSTPNQLNARSESWPLAILEALVATPRPIDRELHRALVEKRREATWRALGQIAVLAATEKRREKLLRQLLGALRTLESPGVRITARPLHPRHLSTTSLPWHWPLRLNAIELATLSAWPVGSTTHQPVSVLSSRIVAASRSVSSRGRVLAMSNKPGESRSLALTPSSSLRHLHLLGPTGTGKSTTLLNLINQDLEAGRGAVVIESKGDLIRDVMATMPEHRLIDVVVLDPTDEAFPVGLNPLSLRGRSPDLVADQLLGTLHSLYAAHWGPRTHDILGSALLTLAQVPNITLCALPFLLNDASFRRRVVGRITDPIALGPFWAQYEAWSDAERAAATAPVQNKIRPLLINPRLRAVLGQVAPRFEVNDVFTKRKILLVNLAKGVVGPEASALLGSLIVAELWQAALGRTSIPASKRHPVFMVFDEFQDFLNLPTDLADALGQARGLGVGLTLAHQHLHQLEPSMRSAVLANARSRLCFQLPLEDAKVIAPSGTLPSAEEFTGLGAYECYVRLMADDSVQPWCSGRTLPPPPPLRSPATVMELSRRRYGTPREEVEANIASFVGTPLTARAVTDLEPRRRRRETE